MKNDNEQISIYELKELLGTEKTIEELKQDVFESIHCEIIKDDNGNIVEAKCTVPFIVQKDKVDYANKWIKENKR